MQKSNRGTFPYLTILLAIFGFFYGGILIYSNGLPYVMDGNESFSVYWHSYNLINFDFTKTWGLTDESFSFDSAAHPYLHTHQGNMPRIFGALIYILGARSVEAQIIITTAVIGTTSLIFSFYLMRHLVNPFFSFIFTVLIFTDYLQFSQWILVTYRVWYSFLFFGILFCIIQASKQSARLATAGLFSLFILLFYNELTFAAMMAIISGLFTAFWYRSKFRMVIKLWAVQIIGALTGLSILVCQLLLKFGLDDVKKDFSQTFHIRNFGNDYELIESLTNFANLNSIVFWPNQFDGSNLTNLIDFIRIQTSYIYQIYTPWLVLEAFIILVGFLIPMLVTSPLTLNWIKKIYELKYCKNLILLLIATYALITALRHPSFGLEVILFIAIAAAAIAKLISIAGEEGNAIRWNKYMLYLHQSIFFNSIRILSYTIIIFSFYYRPSTGLLIIKLLLLVSIFIICITYLKKIEYWLINKNLWMIGSISISLFYLMPLFMGNQILGIQSGSILISKAYITLLVFIIFLISLILILWIRNSYRKIHKKTLLNNEFITKKLFLISSQLIEFLSAQIIEYLEKNKGKLVALNIFIILVTLAISNHFRLYDQNYSSVWILPLSFPAGVALAKLVTLTTIFFIVLSILVGWIVKVSKDKLFSLVNILVLFLIGELAFFLIFCLSPGYIITGYLNRLAPFTVFFTCLPIAAIFYLVAIARGNNNFVANFHRKYNILFRDSFKLNFIFSRYLLPKILAQFILIGLSFYWVKLQFSYMIEIPPNQISSIAEIISKPPLLGSSIVANTYAAPFAALNHKWSYFNDQFHLNKLILKNDRYILSNDNGKYLWLNDRNTNLDYQRPDYFICFRNKSLMTIVSMHTDQFKDEYNFCSRNPIILNIANNTGLMRNELIAKDFSPSSSWGIVKIDKEFPPIAKEISSSLIKYRSHSYIKPSYKYIQQDSTPEGETVVELIGLKDPAKCNFSPNMMVLATGIRGDILPIPTGFTGTIVLRVTPKSIKKIGDQFLSNPIMINANNLSVELCLGTNN